MAKEQIMKRKVQMRQDAIKKELAKKKEELQVETKFVQEWPKKVESAFKECNELIQDNDWANALDAWNKCKDVFETAKTAIKNLLPDTIRESNHSLLLWKKIAETYLAIKKVEIKTRLKLETSKSEKEYENKTLSDVVSIVLQKTKEANKVKIEEFETKIKEISAQYSAEHEKWKKLRGVFHWDIKLKAILVEKAVNNLAKSLLDTVTDHEYDTTKEKFVLFLTDPKNQDKIFDLKLQDAEFIKSLMEFMNTYKLQVKTKKDNSHMSRIIRDKFDAGFYKHSAEKIFSKGKDVYDGYLINNVKTIYSHCRDKEKTVNFLCNYICKWLFREFAIFTGIDADKLTVRTIESKFFMYVNNNKPLAQIETLQCVDFVAEFLDDPHNTKVPSIIRKNGVKRALYEHVKTVCKNIFGKCVSIPSDDTQSATARGSAQSLKRKSEAQVNSNENEPVQKKAKGEKSSSIEHGSKPSVQSLPNPRFFHIDKKTWARIKRVCHGDGRNFRKIAKTQGAASNGGKSAP